MPPHARALQARWITAPGGDFRPYSQYVMILNGRQCPVWGPKAYCLEEGGFQPGAPSDRSQMLETDYRQNKCSVPNKIALATP